MAYGTDKTGVEAAKIYGLTIATNIVAKKGGGNKKLVKESNQGYGRVKNVATKDGIRMPVIIATINQESGGGDAHCAGNLPRLERDRVELHQPVITLPFVGWVSQPSSPHLFGLLSFGRGNSSTLSPINTEQPEGSDYQNWVRSWRLRRWMLQYSKS